MGMRSTKLAALLSGILAGAAPALAQDPGELHLDIVRQPLHSALNEFSLQTGLQVGRLDAPAARALMVGPVKGDYTPEEALSRLLAQSGFTFRRVNDRTIAVIARNTRAGLAAESRDPRRAARRHRTGDPDSAAPGGTVASTDIENVTVTGSRLTSSGEPPSPVAVYDQEWIENLGLSTVGDLLKYLPQQPYTVSDFVITGAQFAELRGSGRDTTLVLINGRRTAASVTGINDNAFDVNSLPLVAVERVEVLSDPATAVYGADAMGGVVNIVLRKDLAEPTVSARYGMASGGGDERRISLTAGHTGERFHGSFVLDYFERDTLLGSERDRTRNQDYTRFGGADIRVPQSGRANISSLTAEPLPGLSSRYAVVPVGSSGIDLTPADFIETAGQQNMTSLLSYFSIVPQMEHASATLYGEFDFGPDITAVGELLYSGRDVSIQLNPARLVNAVVPASNAFNPFDVPVAVNYLFTGIGPRHVETNTDLLRALVGARGSLGRWDWEVSGLTSRDQATQRFTGEVDSARVAAALASSDPVQALNVFQDGPGGGRGLLASLVADPILNRYSIDALQIQGFTRGPLLALPAGSVEGVVGVEWRQEQQKLGSRNSPNPILVESTRAVSSTFAELRLPIISADMTLPGADELTLITAARLDSYDDFGDTFNPRYGLVWRPVADWAARVSYGTSFRSPRLFDLSEPRTKQSLVVVDPRRNNEVLSIPVLIGGNPDLDAIEAQSLSAGIVFTPATMDGLRLEATYWRTRIEDRVSQPPVSTFLANEELFKDRIVRSEPTAEDTAAGLPGRLTSVDVSKINFGWLDTRGVDFEASYDFETRLGRFTPRLTTTWVDEFEDVPATTARVDRVGLASPSGTIPKWHAVATVAWKREAMSLSTAARYISAYEDTLRTTVTERTVRAQFLIDTQLSIDFGALSGTTALLPGVMLTTGVVNLFDRDPGFSETNQIFGIDLSQGTMRGRFGYLKLSKQF